MTDWSETMSEAAGIARMNGAAVATDSRWRSASAWAGVPLPVREWHVADLIPARTVTLLGGDGGTGKSLVAMQLATATVLGRLWLGRDVRAGRALYLSAEDDDDELHRRVAAILEAEGASFTDLDGLTICSLAGEDALLAIPDPRTGVLMETSLFYELDEVLDRERPWLVVLDTLADLHSGNENDRSQSRQFIGILRGLAIRHRCAVLLLAHPSLTGMNTGSGLSGSTAWNASVRSRLYLERVAQEGYEPDPDRRVLRTVKANYGRIGGETGMTWRNGVFVPDETETSLDRLAGTAKAERVFLKLVRILAEQGRRLNPSGGQTYAPNVMASHPEAEGVSKRAFRSAMESLLARGLIRTAEDGPPSKRRQFIEVAG